MNSGIGSRFSATASRCDDDRDSSTAIMTRSADKHRKALSHLRKNEWDKAHAIVMGMRDKLAFRIHGLLHRIEGDLDNARYWYDRAGVPFTKSKSAASEIEEIAAVLERSATRSRAAAATRTGTRRSRQKRSGSRRSRAWGSSPGDRSARG